MEKLSYLIRAAICCCFIQPVQAGLAVVDAGLISTNIQNAKRDLIQQVTQELNQQILIKRADAYLDILGDPSKVNLELVEDILRFLRELGISISPEDVIRDLDEEEIFHQVPGSPYEPIQRDIVVNGEVIGKINPKPFKGEVAVQRSLTNYRSTSNLVIKERAEIKAKLGQVIEQLKHAKTDSETQKLAVAAKALDTQLAAIDREVSFASNELMSRWVELQLEEKIRAKERLQIDRADTREGTRLDREFYQLPSKPIEFKK